MKSMDDAEAKLQITHQDVVADVMHILDHRFLVGVSSPLELLLVCHIRSLSSSDLGTGVQKHFNTFRSRGFEPKRLYIDPHKSLVALQTSFPGVEVDITGAGDHLDKVDIRIRCLKEMMRSIIAGLPFRLGRDWLKGLVTYAVSRMNLRSTLALNDMECPRIRFTRARPEYKSELGLCFGDYVEAYNPRAQHNSNNVMFPRTEPCIALYSSTNKNGLWILYNMTTKSHVRRAQWKKLPMMQIVINTFNSTSGNALVSASDICGEEIQQETGLRATEMQLHIPPNSTTEVGFTAEEAAIDDVDELEDDDCSSDVPDLRHYNDDSDSESGETVEIEEELKELEALLEDYSSDSQAPKTVPQVSLRRSARSTAGARRYDDAYEWNLMNLSVGVAVRSFGAVAADACKAELLQLFQEKKALVPVRWDDLDEGQKKKAVCSHMFLKEKFEDG